MPTSVIAFMVIVFFILLFIGFRKLDKKLEALVEKNNKEMKK
jgi:hypothetical protein